MGQRMQTVKVKKLSWLKSCSCSSRCVVLIMASCWLYSSAHLYTVSKGLSLLLTVLVHTFQSCFSLSVVIHADVTCQWSLSPVSMRIVTIASGVCCPSLWHFSPFKLGGMFISEGFDIVVAVCRRFDPQFWSCCPWGMLFCLCWYNVKSCCVFALLQLWRYVRWCTFLRVWLKLDFLLMWKTWRFSWTLLKSSGSNFAR